MRMNAFYTPIYVFQIVIFIPFFTSQKEPSNKRLNIYSRLLLTGAKRFHSRYRLMEGLSRIVQGIVEKSSFFLYIPSRDSLR